MTIETPQTGRVVMSIATPTPTPTPHVPAPSAPRPPHPRWRGGLEFGAASLGGSYHAENEDSFLQSSATKTLAVADGVGSGARGKVASLALIERIGLLTPELLASGDQRLDWLLAADKAVAAAIARHSQRKGAATFVAAVPTPDRRRWHLAWVGDCRAYLLTACDTLLCLTLDDSYGNLGETPPPSATFKDPARMVGNGAIGRSANHAQVALNEGEILLLCSDGIHRFVPEDEIITLLRAPKKSLEARCQQLAAAAQGNGGYDDATAVAAERHRRWGPSNPFWFGVAFGFAFALVLMLLVLAFRLGDAPPSKLPASVTPGEEGVQPVPLPPSVASVSSPASVALPEIQAPPLPAAVASIPSPASTMSGEEILPQLSSGAVPPPKPPTPRKTRGRQLSLTSGLASPGKQSAPAKPRKRESSLPAPVPPSKLPVPGASGESAPLPSGSVPSNLPAPATLSERPSQPPADSGQSIPSPASVASGEMLSLPSADAGPFSEPASPSQNAIK